MNEGRFLKQSEDDYAVDRTKSMEEKSSIFRNHVKNNECLATVAAPCFGEESEPPAVRVSADPLVSADVLDFRRKTTSSQAVEVIEEASGICWSLTIPSLQNGRNQTTVIFCFTIPCSFA